MTPEKAIDLLNVTAKKLCPGLHLNFLPARNDNTVVARILVADFVEFDIRKLNKININIVPLFKENVNAAIDRMIEMEKWSKIE